MDGIAPHGKTDPAIVREILLTHLGRTSNCDSDLEPVIESYLSFLGEEVRHSTAYRVLPGILEILQEMAARPDVMLGLATGNMELGARIKLERGGLNPYFGFGGFGSDSENRAALVRKGAEAAARKGGGAIPPGDVFVIGDTPRDIEAGREAGFRTVGVGTGSYPADQLLESGATFAISDFQQGRDQFLRSAFIE